MTDDRDDVPDDGTLPMQPTGSGVADLEVAFEQMKLAAGDEGASLDAGTDLPPDAAASAAHPS